MTEPGGGSPASDPVGVPGATHAPEPSRRGGRCCLFGCGAVAILCLLVAVGVWWGYREVAQPWWEAKLDEWEERYPAVSWLRTARDLWAFGPQARFDRMAGGIVETGAFPDDVYLPPVPRRGAVRVYEDEAVAVLELAGADVSQLAAEYRREMAARGWSHTPVRDPADGVRLLFTREGRRVVVTLVGRDGVTEVWVEAGLPPGQTGSAR